MTSGKPLWAWLDHTGAFVQVLDYLCGDTVRSELSGRVGVVIELYPELNRALVRTLDGTTTDSTATSLRRHVEPPTETERLDWIFRQADEYSCTILQDQPGDGLYRVTGMAVAGEGATPRDALDAAIAAEAELRRAQGVKS